jgi:hypothetical protein
MYDFFVSYTGVDKAWAEWVGWILEENGQRVVLQAWDFRPGSNFVIEMQRARLLAESAASIGIVGKAHLSESTVSIPSPFVATSSIAPRRTACVRIAPRPGASLALSALRVALPPTPESHSKHVMQCRGVAMARFFVCGQWVSFVWCQRSV